MKHLWIITFGLASPGAFATISYRVEALPDTGKLHITIQIPKTEKGAVLQIPSWAPGAYMIRDASVNVQNLKAMDDKGASLAIEAKSEVVKRSYESAGEKLVAERNLVTWVIAPARSTTVEYDIDSRVTDGAMHWSGPSTYLYEVNRKQEKCMLELKLPSGWPCFVGLDEQRGKAASFVAKDYDTLADNPVTIGNVLVDTYISRGKPHFIVMRNAAKSAVDRAKLLKACKFVSDAETDFFGGRAPYNKYVWHFAVNPAADGAGGLEHLSSTQISLASGVGPRAVGVLAHEFFHLWNVKRIRSQPLGPFDYTRLPDTGALWWLEGVTDYYAYTILHRYGWNDEASYFATLNSNIQQVRRSPNSLKVGPYESSMRVAETSSGRGNSNGYLISYYDLGWIAGLCLDIEIRAETGGKRSLDDVEIALWNLCKDGKPGFAEDEIRKQCVRFGGPALGPIYDRIVMQPNMPVADSLAKVGLEIVTKKEEFLDVGFSWIGGRGQATLPVSQIRGPAVGKLQLGDTIVSVNGKNLEGASGRALSQSMTTAVQGFTAGVPFKLGVLRSGATIEVDITPVTGTRESFSVARVVSPTAEQKKIADSWLAKKVLKP